MIYFISLLVGVTIMGVGVSCLFFEKTCLFFEKNRFVWAIAIFLLGVVVASSSLYTAPNYEVWERNLSGQAALAKSKQTKQIRIESAKAKKESAQYEADAEVIKATGVAEANKIIADGLGGAEGYLRWRYIEMLQETGSAGRETIYIPTEAGMPIFEAGRLQGRNK